MKLLRLSYIIAMIVYGLALYTSLKKHNYLAFWGWSCTIVLAIGLIIILEINEKSKK